MDNIKTINDIIENQATLDKDQILTKLKEFVANDSTLGTIDTNVSAITKVWSIEDIKTAITDRDYLIPDDDTLNDIFEACLESLSECYQAEWDYIDNAIDLYTDELTKG